VSEPGTHDETDELADDEDPDEQTTDDGGPELDHRRWDGVTALDVHHVDVALPRSYRPRQGVPVDPEGYDYRRAALYAMHFAKLEDRWVEKLRPGAGFTV